MIARVTLWRRFICLFAAALYFISSLATAGVETRGVARIAGVGAVGPQLSDHYSASYALLIGNSEYTHPAWDKLPSIPHELASVERMLQRQGFEVETLSNVSSQELLSSLSDFAVDKGGDPNNRLLVYFAGHGETIQLSEQQSMGYLVPADAPPYSSDKHGFITRALSMNRVMAMAKEIQSKHAMFVFDSCFSGSIFQSRGFASSSGRSLEGLLEKPVRYFITSGSANETVPAESAFTRAFVDSFESGAADLNRDGYVTSTELGLHLTQNVPFASQTPQHGKINDYALSRGDVVFSSLVNPLQPVSPEDASPEAIASDFELRAELLFWQEALEKPSVAGYEEYLRKYPDGRFVTSALQLRQSLVDAELGLAANVSTVENQQASIRVGVAPTKVLGAAMHWEVNFSSESEVTGAVKKELFDRLASHGLDGQLLTTERSSGGWIKRKRSKYGIDREVYRYQTHDEQGMMGVVVRMRDDNSAGELQLVFSVGNAETFSKKYYFQGEAGLARATNRALDQIFEPALDVVMR